MHRVLGLTAGAGLFISGLSGSALVFRQDIDAALNPELLRVVPAETRVPMEAIVDEVQRAHPGDTVTRIRMPQRADGTYEFWLGQSPRLYVYADPYTGRVLGERRPTEFLTGWLFLLHSQLFAGELGGRVAGVGALVLVLLSITGLVAWWPRRLPWTAWKQWRAALTVKRHSGAKRATYDLHRAIGFYASALLLIVGVTGASLIFHEAFAKMSYWVTGSRAPAVVALAGQLVPTSGMEPLPLDDLIAIAERAQPGGTISYLYLPATPAGAIQVRKRLPGEKHPNGKSFVTVQTTGRVLSVQDATEDPRGARLYSILYPLHIGTIGGVWTRVLAVMVGLTLPILAVTGAMVWWRTWRARRRRFV